MFLKAPSTVDEVKVEGLGRVKGEGWLRLDPGSSPFVDVGSNCGDVYLWTRGPTLVKFPTVCPVWEATDLRKPFTI